MNRQGKTLFILRKILQLFGLSVLITAALYYIDSDPPSDSFAQVATNTLLVFGFTCLIYILRRLCR